MCSIDILSVVWYENLRSYCKTLIIMFYYCENMETIYLLVVYGVRYLNGLLDFQKNLERPLLYYKYYHLPTYVVYSNK